MHNLHVCKSGVCTWVVSTYLGSNLIFYLLACIDLPANDPCLAHTYRSSIDVGYHKCWDHAYQTKAMLQAPRLFPKKPAAKDKVSGGEYREDRDVEDMQLEAEALNEVDFYAGTEVCDDDESPLSVRPW